MQNTNIDKPYYNFVASTLVRINWAWILLNNLCSIISCCINVTQLQISDH